MTILFEDPAPYEVAEFTPCELATDVRDEVKGIIAQSILDHPRSLQKRIGPSEIGTGCDLCLGRKLAGIPQIPEVAWFPFIGTAVHSSLEQVFSQHLEFDVERKVSVGEIDGEEITGTADLFDRRNHIVIDWKIAGSSTLSKARRQEINPEYHAQAHLYGRGFVRAGERVEKVAIFFLPRDVGDLDRAVWYAEPYDESVAISALQRADALAKRIRIEGAQNVLPTLTKVPGCYGCRRFPEEEK